MITPLTTTGAVDEASVERLVHYMVENGVSGLFVMGTSGEGPWLDTTQRTTLIRATVQAVAGRVPVLAGALEPSTPRTLEVIKQIQDLGADAIVIAAPYYLAADESVQREHIDTIARTATLPLVLYNIPQMTHNVISVETVRQSMKYDNIIGIKDSTGDWDHFLALLDLRQERSGFRVFQGAEKLSARSILAGADGLVPGMGNLIPATMRQITELAHDENQIMALQDRADRLWALHTHGYWLPCLKYAASLLGFGSGRCVGRSEPLPVPDQQAILQLVKQHIPQAII